MSRSTPCCISTQAAMVAVKGLLLPCRSLVTEAIFSHQDYLAMRLFSPRWWHPAFVGAVGEQQGGCLHLQVVQPLVEVDLRGN